MRRQAKPPKAVKIRENKPRPRVTSLDELEKARNIRRKEIDFFMSSPQSPVQNKEIRLFSKRFMGTHNPNKHNDSDHNTMFTDVS